MNKTLIGIVTCGSLVAVEALALAQGIPYVTLPYVTTINPTDAFQDIVLGTPTTQSQYTTAAKLAGFVHSQNYGSPPVLTSCGTGPAVAGNDTSGTVTMGTGGPTGCIITFAVARNSAPTCLVTWHATPLASQSYVVSATALTLTQTATSSNLISYYCPFSAGN